MALRRFLQFASHQAACVGFALATGVASAQALGEFDSAPVFITGANDLSVPEGSFDVGNVRAIDNENDAISYRIGIGQAGGADRARFSINTVTGLLSFTTAPDFEDERSTANTTVYEVAITASSTRDSTGTTQRASRTFNVAVLDLDTAPSFLTTHTTFSVLEGSGMSNLATFSTDSPVDYSLSGVNANDFSITLGGTLRFKVAPVFVTGGNNIRSLTVIATSRHASADRVSLDVTVNIQDDQPPEFTVEADAFAIDEGQRVVGMLSGIDPDGSAVTYHIPSGPHGGPDGHLFNLTSQSRPSLLFRDPPDFEDHQSAGDSDTYSVRIIATSTTLPNSAQSTAQVFNIEARDVESDPVFIGGTNRSFFLLAGVVYVDAIRTERAVSWDFGGSDSDLFNFLPFGSIGFIFYKSPSVFDPDGDNSRELEIIATSLDAARDRTTLSVTVMVQEDMPPGFTTNENELSIPEGERIVGKIVTTEPNQDSVHLTIIGGDDSSRFGINYLNELFFINARDFESQDSASGGDDIYDVEIEARSYSGDNAAMTASRLFSVEVTDTDQVPQFLECANSCTLNIRESSLFVGNFATNIPVQYTLLGPDAGIFRINANGDLSFIQRRDYSPANSWSVTVSATSQHVARDVNETNVTVTLFDDLAPVFQTEANAFSINEGESEVGFVLATDANNAEPVRYRIDPAFAAADNDAFEITPNGALSFISAPDFEADDSASGDDTYSVRVLAESIADNGQSRSADRTFEVSVRDLDQVPTLAAAAAEYDLLEGTSLVSAFRAVDASVSWSVAGDDAADFQINAAGALSFIEPSVYSESGNNERAVTVIATNNAPSRDAARFDVRIRTIQDATPIFTTAANDFSVPEGQTLVGIVVASDPNHPTYSSSITYAVSGGADVARFTIGRASGELSLLVPADFEVPSSAAGSNTYEVTVTASSVSLENAPRTTDLTLNVVVLDAEDIPLFAGTNTGQRSVTALEFVTEVGRFAASVEQGLVNYTLTGPDALAFNIDTQGVLAYRAPPVFDATGGATNIRNINIVATSVVNPARSSMLVLRISIEADTPPVFANSTLALSVSEGTQFAHRVTATDANSANHRTVIRYVISDGADADLFSIDDATGDLNFINAPDFEVPLSAAANNTYQVQVSASSSTLGLPEQTARQNLTITVTDLDGAPLFAIGAGPIIRNIIAGATSAGIFIAGSSTTYSISSTDPDESHDDFFSISETGELTFRTAAVFNEGGVNTYNISVTATDAGPSGDLASLAVTINIANNRAPVISSADAFTIQEGLTRIGVIVANDPDNANFPTRISYAITAGADSALFSLEPDLGFLAFVAPRDFEDDVSAANTNVYEVIVTVTGTVTSGYSAGAASSTSRTLEVAVGNIGMAPSFIDQGDTAMFEVVEGTTLLGTLSVNERVDFVLEGDDASFFSIESDGDLFFSGGARAKDDGGTRFEFNVLARSPAISMDSSSIEVIVTVMVDEAPEFLTAEDALSVDEGVTLVGIVEAEDANDDSRVSFGLNGGMDAALFEIDMTSGQLSFLNARDFEDDNSEAGTDIYEVIVRATSTTQPPAGGGAGSGMPLSTDRTFMVAVVDVEAEPMLLAAENDFSVLSGVSDPVAVFEASGSVNWSVGGEDVADFSITSDGELSFNMPPLFVNDGDNTRVLDVIATNQSPAADSTILPVTITITRDFPPLWVTPPDLFTIEEGQTEIGTLLATDANNPLHPTSITYAITGGADAALFRVNSDTGALSFLVARDFEDHTSAAGTNEYEVEVTVTSQAVNAAMHTATRVFMVQVDNVGGEPQFTNPQSRFFALAGVVRVATFSLNTAASFSLGGADATTFTISTAGELDFLSPPTFTEGGDNEYEIIVIATSSGTAGDSTSLAVSIEVINDAPPVFVDSETTLYIYEGASIVALLRAEDANNPQRTSSITYSVTGGADMAWFEIDAGTGALGFITAPDFEEDDSAAGTDEYEVEVTVSSTTFPAPPQRLARTYSVTVLNVVAEPMFVTSAPTGSFDVLEGTTAVASFAVDTPSTYSLAGIDAGNFSVSEQGEVSFNTEAIFTTGDVNMFSLTVIATANHPSGDAARRDISVNVIEDAPPVWITAFDALTMNEGELLAGVLMASDANVPDFNNTFSYALSGGADEALFVIDANTGALSFAVSPDFENDASNAGTNVYAVEVTISSRSGTAAARQAVRTFNVSVENVDEQPVFEATPARIEVIEGAQAVMTYSAVSETGEVSYRIESAADITDLSIDLASGALRFVAPAIFDRTEGASNSRSLMVIATALADATQSTSVALRVVVVEDVPPTWVGAASFSLKEGETLVGQAQASDTTSANFSTSISYSITGGADSERFALNAETGVVSFKMPPDFEDDASASGTNVYTLVITATSTTLASGRTQQITRPYEVIVNDVSTTPAFVHGNQASTRRLAVLEGVRETQTLFTNTAVRYEISPQFTAIFSINSNTGELTFIRPPVFVVGATNEMRVEVIATSVNQAADTARFTLIIEIIDDAPPDLSAANSSYSLEEGLLAVGRINATEPNGDLVSFALDSALPDHSLFRIDPESGRLRFRTAPDFESPLSAASSNTYRLRVLASSVSLPNPPQTSRLDIEVEVTNDAINVPVFATNIETAISILEGSPRVGTFRATLPDPNLAIAYSLEGRDAALFFIGGVSAELRFVTTPVFQPRARNTYQLDLVATSQAPSADRTSLELRISVVEDTPPVFSDRLLPPVLEGEHMVAAIIATDANLNSPVRYAISGGVDRASFAMGEQNGMLSFRAAPNFDQPTDLASVDPIIDAAANNEYVVSITATSATAPNPPKMKTITHVVTVSEARRRPRFERLAFQISEGGVVNVGALRILDPEEPVLAMRITGGADALMFNIGLTTQPENNARQLRFVRAPDFENPLDLVSPANNDGGTAQNPTPPNRANNNIYVVRVTADFAGGNSLTADVLVTVINMDEGRTFVGQTRFVHPENASIVTFLRLINIDDGTSVTNPGLRVVGGADAALFAVDDATGALSFIDAPNFEMPPRLAGGDNTFNVQVTASNAPVIDLVVDVVNVDEAPVLAGPFNFSVNESGALLVHTFTASDEDGDLLSYQISGIDADLFEIGVLTGALSFRTAPDFEQPGDADRDNAYELVLSVIASTQEPKSDRQPVRVMIQDVSESLVFNDSEFQVAATTVQVGRLQVELGQLQPQTVSFSIVGGPDNEHFSISGDQLMFNQMPNFASPLDTNGDNIYELILQASATLSGSLITDRAMVRVRVNPGVEENSPSVTDLPLGDSASISGGVDADLFRITNGQLAFIDSPDFENPRDKVSITPPDAAANNNYVVATTSSNGIVTTHIISVIDQANEAAEAGTDQLVAVGDTVILQGQLHTEPGASYSFAQVSGPSVTLTDIGTRSVRFRVPDDANDALFVFRFTVVRTGGAQSNDDVRVQVRPAPLVLDQSLTLPEGVAPATLLGEPFQVRNFATTSAGRSDSAPRGVWSITSGNDDNLFAVSQTTGQVSLVSALDFERQASHSIRLQYTQDGISGHGNLNLMVTNLNEAPMVELGDDRLAPVSTTVVLTATVSDPEQAANDLTYNWVQLEGTPVMLEDARTATARFTPERTLGGELLVFSLTVTDGEGKSAQDTVAIEISDDPVDEGMLAPGEATVMEDAILGALVGSPLETTGFAVGTGVWRIISGNESNLFDISTASGQIRLQGLLDFEAEPAHMLEISYQLGLLRGTNMLAITVEDVDEAPTADAGGAQRVVSSGQMVALNATQSRDPEDMMELTYLWVQLSGTPVSLDDETSATPTFTAPVVTAAAPLTLSFSLTVTDSGDQAVTVMQDIRVVNSDVAPIITTNMLSSLENQKDVGLIEAVDADRDPITYRLGPGGDEALFELTEDGDLSFRVAPNFEDPRGTGDGGTADNRYLLNVIATSIRDGGRAQATTGEVFVEVVNDTDEAPVFSLEVFEYSVIEGATSPFVRLAARDPEDNNLNFTITAGVDRGQFNVDSVSGALSFRSPPDFETPADLQSDNPPDPEGNNTYVLVVSATATGVNGVAQSDTLSLLVKVTDNPDETLEAATFDVPTNAINGATIGQPLVLDGSFAGPGSWRIVTVTRTDPDTFELIELRTEDLFSISTTSGQLSVGGGLDRLFAARYDVNIRIESGDGQHLDGVAQINVSPDPTPGTVSLSDTTPVFNLGVDATLEDAGNELNLEWRWQVLEDERWNNLINSTMPHYVPTVQQGARPIRAVVTYVEDSVRRRVNSEASEPVTTDANVRKDVVTAALAVISRSLAEDALTVIGRRMTGQGRNLLNVGGLGLGPTSKGDDYANSSLGWMERFSRLAVARQNNQNWSWRDGTSFSRQLAGNKVTNNKSTDEQGNGDSVPIWVIWGEASRRTFSGRPTSEVSSMNGDTESIWIGLDRYFNAYGLFGAGLQYSESELGFSSEQEGDGSLTSTLTTIYPYLHYSPVNSVSLWGIAGYGIGNIHYRSQAVGDIAHRASANFTLLSAGGRIDLLDLGGSRTLFSIKTDGLYSALENQAAAGLIPAARGEFWRFRVGFGVDFDWEIPSASSVLISTVDLSTRLDRGNAERGLGLEVNADTTWRHLSSGLALVVHINKLIAHEHGALDQTGFGFGISVDAGKLGEGLALSFTPTFGYQSAADILSGLGSAGSSTSALNPYAKQSKHCMKLKASYGILAGQLRITPEFEMSDSIGTTTRSLGIGGNSLGISGNRNQQVSIALKLDWIYK